ncbi:DNA polymerase/3'-5' exonuclease PolX [Alicyclobacillus hesperidum subsp. aegles]|uniref:DNA polymerase/3'-5' exonuclease PolX n=1 Tax=Alicyclobacillus hesperidum TaxID=89784 RepID=UPI00222B992B|nr:DNA polymerase/3'-5' exonuclease PolX [Alicyclobacillus hesperidum]GLG01949.1 DNA polymerase/3'-5' exonuclease PolX [Alicyclobacillus hesperidum subsp. aegles]
MPNRHRRPDPTEALQLLGVPREVAELCELPGVGPKIAADLYRRHRIATLEGLAEALNRSPRTFQSYGHNTVDRWQRDLPVLLERRHSWPIALAAPQADAICAELANLSGVTAVSVTGSVRRLAAMNRCIELVVACADRSALDAWCQKAGAVTRMPADYPSAIATIRCTTGSGADELPVLIHVALPEAFAAALLQSTGDPTHVEVVTKLLAEAGLTWSEAGLMHRETESIPIASEAELYARIGLPWLPPELREGESMLQSPSFLIQQADIRGDLHMHSTWSDGSLTIAELAETAERMGYEYIAVTDHSQSLTIAHGLTPDDLRRQRGEIEQVRRRAKVHILHGSEVDILADGRLDFPDEVLADLDIVIASIHTVFTQSRDTMTRRIQRALANPHVHILAHMHGRLIGKRSGYAVDTEQVLAAAAHHGVMIELNSNPNRLDIWDEWIRKAVKLGIAIPIDTDAHEPGEMNNITYGVRMGIRGWLPQAQVPNTLSYAELKQRLDARRMQASVKG